MIDLLHEKRNKEIIKRYSFGITTRTLAKENNLTLKRIKEILKGINPVKEKLKQFDIEKMRNDGMSWESIGKSIHVHPSTLVKYYSYPRYGIKDSEKYCHGCRTNKPISLFHSKTNWCKDCVNSHHREVYRRKHYDKDAI